MLWWIYRLSRQIIDIDVKGLPEKGVMIPLAAMKQTRPEGNSKLWLPILDCSVMIRTEYFVSAGNVTFCPTRHEKLSCFYSILEDASFEIHVYDIEKWYLVEWTEEQSDKSAVRPCPSPKGRMFERICQRTLFIISILPEDSRVLKTKCQCNVFQWPSNARKILFYLHAFVGYCSCSQLVCGSAAWLPSGRNKKLSPRFAEVPALIKLAYDISSLVMTPTEIAARYLSFLKNNDIAWRPSAS